MIRHNIFNLLVTDRKAAYAKHFRLLLPFIIGMGTVSYFLLQIKPTEKSKAESKFYWLRQLNEAKLNGDHQAVEELLAHPKFGPHHH